MNMRDRVERAYKGKPGPDADAGVDRPEPRPAASRQGAPGHARKAVAKAGIPAAAARNPAAARTLAAAEDKAEGLLKTGDAGGLAKAARFLLLLGTEEASKVLTHLSPREVEALSREIIKVKTMDSVEANDILAEFGWLVKTKGYAIEGGAETAEKMLQAAFGPDKARELIRRAVPGSLRPFRFLAEFEPRELQIILKEESPQVVAVVLPYLDPKRASGLLERLPEELRIEVVKRVAHLEKVSPEILRRVEEGLKERIRKVGTISTEELDGKAALAGILRHVDPRLEESVLAALEEESPELSRSVRERLFTMDDLLRVPDRDLQKALRNFADRDLALLLKGRNQDFKDKLLGNVSQNRKALILDEYSILGAVRREDADEAAREFLAFLKAAWEGGDLVLEGEDELVD
jgi:flagellar motor switch protein FliG